jgi:tetratricopeptide (TPR) repeat protein
MPSRRRAVITLAAVLLVVAVAGVYAPVRHADFVNLDDEEYVTRNPGVRAGVTVDGLRQAFFGTRGALWMPLAFVSHMVDVELFGLEPRGHHLVNVGLHAANAVLLLALLVRATGAVAPSVAVAAIFAVHPLRVESVAWIAERKDVLSVAFALLTFHAWVSWVARPTLGRQAALLLAATLAMLSKPMMMTLPLFLLCLDFWPLRRRESLGRLVLEKAPLGLVALGVAIITLVGLRAGGALTPLAEHGLGARVANACAAYVWYVVKTLAPRDLAVSYPRVAWPAAYVAGAAAALAAAAAVAIASRRRAPWISMGLAWFTIGLAPVIGIVQAGTQAMADRFAYLPSIGLLVAIVWTVDAAVPGVRLRRLLAGATALWVAALGVAARAQVHHWQDSEHLHRRTLAVTERNHLAHTHLANALAARHRFREAYEHYDAAVRIEPRDAKAVFGLGVAAEGLGAPEEAMAHYQATLEIAPANAKAHNNLGILLFERGDAERALHHFSEAVRLDPAAGEAVANLTLALRQHGIAADEAERYAGGLAARWAAVVADRARPGGDAYGASLAGRLLGAEAAGVAACVREHQPTRPAPINLYVTLTGDGRITDVTAAPPTALARCIGAELRDATAPAPPFAPFHAQVGIQG